MPMLSPMSSNPATTEGKRFVFRLAFLDDVQGEVMGRFALDDLDATTAGVLYDRSTAYGRDLAAVFRETFEAGGGRVVSFESYSRDAAEDFSEQLSRVKRASPDVLYLPNDTQPVLARSGRPARWGSTCRSWAATPGICRPSGRCPECDGSYIAHQWHPQLDTREAKAFVERYRAAFGEEPKVTAAMTFDAVSLMVDVLRRVESLDPAAIREGLLETTDFVGATGRVGFDGRPDPERSVMISTIQDGESRLLRAEVR